MRSKRLPLYALVAADALSLAGSVVATLAIPWFVLATTGSAARTGIAAFFATVPLALGALLGGVIVDRFGARRSSVVADLFAGLSIATIPALYAMGRLSYWHVLALAFAAGAFDGPGRAARLALLPDLATRAELPLERANAIARTAEHFGYVLGAPTAGVLIATLGAAGALWIDALSFGVSALVIALTVPRVTPAARRGGRYLAELSEGLRFVGREPVLRTLLTMAALGSFCIAPLASVLLPVYARDRLGGATDFAALIAAYGFGGLAGALAFGVFGTRFTRRAVYIGTWGLAFAMAVVLVMLPPLEIALLALFGLGTASGALAPLELTIWQERAPKELRARILATATAIPLLTDGVAFVVAGAVVAALGLRAGLAIHAVGDAVLFAAAVLLPAIRLLDPTTASAPRSPQTLRSATTRAPVSETTQAKTRA